MTRAFASGALEGRCRTADERGITTVEMITVVMFLAIFTFAIFTSLDSFTKTTAATQDKTSTLGEVRGAVETIARDLRAANPIDEYPIGEYSTKAQFSVYCSAAGVSNCDTDNLRPVTYRVVDHKLEQIIGTQAPRTLLGPTGASTLPANLRRGAVVNSASEPVFTYYDKFGVAFDPATAAPRTIHDCTRSVEIHLKVLSEHRNTANPINFVTRVDLRNFNGAQC